jgi:NAD(P)-dependent dehydrogenase (short-subunit alcohol dehydrogenase family)
MSTWTTADLPDLTGRTVVVTGSNSGIGRMAARALAGAGAHVILAVRDTAKGDEAAATMTGSTEVRRLDLADLASVREFAGGITDDIQVLINNAGVMAVPQSRTKDGFEMQIGTNYLGHFALTNLLLDRITDRVVTLSSGVHRMGTIRLEDLNWEKPGSYNPWQAYAQSKLADLLFTAELQRRLTAAGSTVISTAAHPGWAATNLQGRTTSRLNNGFMAVVNRTLAQTDEMGALPTLYAATADIPGNSFAGPSGVGELRGAPKLVGRSRRANDPALAGRLWDLSEQLTGVQFPLPTSSAA